MPKEFWPDELVVTGRYRGAELAFALTAHDFQTTFDNFGRQMEFLRAALWEAGSTVEVGKGVE